MEKVINKLPLYKWAQGNYSVELLKKEGGENIRNVGTDGPEANSECFYYMPYLGGKIEWLFRNFNDAINYIKAHGIEIRPKEILTDSEKKYLSDVIRPWRDKVVNMKKIKIEVFEYVSILLGGARAEVITLPVFPENTRYKGMELDNEYKLEELGL